MTVESAEQNQVGEKVVLPVRKQLRRVALALAILLVGAMLAGAGLLAYPLVAYRDQIYPGISVHGVDLGELTVDQATALLASRLPDAASEGITLRAGDHSWRLSWADAGQGYDHAGTAMAAYQIAREGTWHQRVFSVWQVRMEGHTLPPRIIPAEPGRVEAVLEQTAALINVAPAEAQLEVGPTGVVPVPGRPGQALDVEASSVRVLDALTEDAIEVDLPMVPVLPRLAEPEPALTLARALLAQPFTLIADDLPTDYYAEFSAPPERMATWLQVVPEFTESSASIGLAIDDAAVEAWLLEIRPQLGPERTFEIPETFARAMAALSDGEHQFSGRIRHPEKTYTVQPGDYLFGIAYEHGFPQWRLEEANPDVDPEALEIGMELVIPSIDVLLPEPIAPGKLIEINLPEQRLRAYNHGELAYEFTCSTGMSSTPTISGQFQVLMKEENAHAPRWSLDMPYFLGIYKEGPEFYNGIHELPITAGGRRLWGGVLGWPASYGCIILDIGDAETLFEWAPIGTLVRILGTAPGTPTYEQRVEQIQQESQAEE